MNDKHIYTLIWSEVYRDIMMLGTFESEEAANNAMIKNINFRDEEPTTDIIEEYIIIKNELNKENVKNIQ